MTVLFEELFPTDITVKTNVEARETAKWAKLEEKSLEIWNELRIGYGSLIAR